MPGTAVARSTLSARGLLLFGALLVALVIVGDSKSAATAPKPPPGARPGEHDRTLARLGAPVCDRAGRFRRDDLARRLRHIGVVSRDAAVNGARRPRREQRLPEHLLRKESHVDPGPDDAELVVPRRVHGAGHRAGSSVLAPFQGNQLPRADLAERNSARCERGRHDGCSLVQRDEPDQRRWLERPCDPRHPAGPRLQGPLRVHGRLEPGGTRHERGALGCDAAWIRPGLLRSPIRT